MFLSLFLTYVLSFEDKRITKDKVLVMKTSTPFQSTTKQNFLVTKVVMTSPVSNIENNGTVVVSLTGHFLENTDPGLYIATVKFYLKNSFFPWVQKVFYFSEFEGVVPSEFVPRDKQISGKLSLKLPEFTPTSSDGVTKLEVCVRLNNTNAERRKNREDCVTFRAY